MTPHYNSCEEGEKRERDGGVSALMRRKSLNRASRPLVILTLFQHSKR